MDSSKLILKIVFSNIPEIALVNFRKSFSNWSSSYVTVINKLFSFIYIKLFLLFLFFTIFFL